MTNLSLALQRLALARSWDRVVTRNVFMPKFSREQMKSMGWRSAVLAMTVVAPAPWPANSAPLPKDANSKSQVEAYIRACEGEWAYTEVTGDGPSIGTFVAEDYEGVSSHSVVVNRAKAIEAFAPDANVVSDKLDYVHIRFPSADLAIAQGGETATLKNGTRKSLIWTDTWLLRNGRWQIVTSQDSPLPKPYAQPRP